MSSNLTEGTKKRQVRGTKPESVTARRNGQPAHSPHVTATMPDMTTAKRAARAGVEDRWHRPARKGEQVYYPADNADGPVWCMDPKHTKNPGTLVCSARHGTGRRWMARWVDHDGVERMKTFDRRNQADEQIRVITTALGTGTYADPQRSATTFGTVAAAWLDTKRAAKRASKTVEGYQGLLDVLILPKWGGYALKDISHERLQEWFTWLATNPKARKHPKRDEEGEIVKVGLSPTRVIQTHNVVSQVLTYAIRCKYLGVNPATDIELPSKGEGKDLALTHDQMRTLADATAKAEAVVRHRKDTKAPALTPADLRTMVLLMGYGGLRFGEAIALRVEKVKLAIRRIRVDRSITYVRGKGWIEGDTKTHQRRDVPILTTELVDGLEKAIEGRAPGDYVFPGPDGKAMTIGWFRVRFDKAVEALGIEGVTPHTLRHSAGSLAISESGSGTGVIMASKLLGHRNVTTTANVYSHMLDGDWDKLTAAMEKATARD